MTEDDLIKRQEIDEYKTKKAIENNFNFLRISSDDNILEILNEEIKKLNNVQRLSRKRVGSSDSKWEKSLWDYDIVCSHVKT